MSSGTGTVSIGEEGPASAATSSGRKRKAEGRSSGLGPKDPEFWERRLSEDPADLKHYACGAYDSWSCALCFSGHPEKDPGSRKWAGLSGRIGNRGSRSHIGAVRSYYSTPVLLAQLATLSLSHPQHLRKYCPGVGKELWRELFGKKAIAGHRTRKAKRSQMRISPTGFLEAPPEEHPREQEEEEQSERFSKVR